MSDSIKFTPAPDNTIPTYDNATSYSDVFMVGALQLTSKPTFPDNSTHYRHYQTDKAGLELASMKASEIVNSLHDAIKVIGILTAYADLEGIQHHQADIGWLIAGLSELAGDVNDAHLDMKHSIANYDRYAEGKK